MAGNSPLHFGRSAGANLPLNSSLRAIALSCHTSARAGSGAGLACCKVGLYRPLIPTAFVANWFRSARVSRPRRSADGRSPGEAPTVGDCGRRGRAGQEALPEPAFEVPGSSRAWLGGPTDARENLKMLRRQLGLRNN